MTLVSFPLVLCIDIIFFFLLMFMFFLIETKFRELKEVLDKTLQERDELKLKYDGLSAQFEETSTRLATATAQLTNIRNSISKYVLLKVHFFTHKYENCIEGMRAVVNGNSSSCCISANISNVGVRNDILHLALLLPMAILEISLLRVLFEYLKKVFYYLLK